VLTILFSCSQNATTKQKLVNYKSDTYKKISVDYKSDTYKILLGEHYKISNKVIDWHWDAMSSDHNEIDSTGKEPFFYMGEPLINYNENTWLPFIQIETEKNIITSFTCSILFVLDKNSRALDNFLKLLNKDIKQLKNEELVQSLKTKGYYKADRTDCVEVFEFIKAKKYGYDRFLYKITASKKNNR